MQKLMEMIDEIKKDIPEGKYLDMCNLLKKMYNDDEIELDKEKKITALRQALEYYDKKMNRRVQVHFEDDILHPHSVFINCFRTKDLVDNVWEYEWDNRNEITIEV
jgi:hypothetical protein